MPKTALCQALLATLLVLGTLPNTIGAAFAAPVAAYTPASRTLLLDPVEVAGAGLFRAELVGSPDLAIFSVVDLQVSVETAPVAHYLPESEDLVIPRVAVPDLGFFAVTMALAGTDPPRFDLVEVSPVDDPPAAGFSRPAPDQFSIATNVGWVTDYAAEIKFCDLFRQARPFIPETDGVWDSGTLQLRSDGYPTHIPQGDTIARSVLALAAQGEQIPAGTYTFSYQGSGTVVLSGDGLGGDHRFTAAGSYPLAITPDAGGIWVAIESSAAADPVRGLELLMPDQAELCGDSPYYPPFIDFMADFSAVRFAQTLQTNDGSYPCDNGVPATDPTCVKEWTSRTTLDAFTQAAVRGPAYEHVVAMANQAGVDLWLNVQHGASDQFMAELAALACNRLDPDLRLYVEYSNEVWNSAYPYPQHQWAMANGEALGLEPGDPFLAGQKFFVETSLRMFEIFEQACGDARLVNVLGGLIGMPGVNRQMLEHAVDPAVNPAGIEVEALAIAPYIGYWIADYLHAEGLTATTSAEDVIDLVTRNLDQFIQAGDSLEESLAWLVSESKAVADDFGTLLIAYEGGQHLVQNRGWENDEQLGELMIAVNRDPRMREVYTTLLDIWEASEAGIFAHYTGVGAYTVAWGSFPVAESYNAASAPKLEALLDRQRRLGWLTAAE